MKSLGIDDIGFVPSYLPAIITNRCQARFDCAKGIGPEPMVTWKKDTYPITYELFEAAIEDPDACNVPDPKLIGNGNCDGGAYNVKDCGNDGGDCNCNVPDIEKIGDGVCDGLIYNIFDCNWDGGDCNDFNTKYPSCKAPKPSLIGNGECNYFQYNNEACNWE